MSSSEDDAPLMRANGRGKGAFLGLFGCTSTICRKPSLSLHFVFSLLYLYFVHNRTFLIDQFSMVHLTL